MSRRKREGSTDLWCSIPPWETSQAPRPHVTIPCVRGVQNIQAERDRWMPGVGPWGRDGRGEAGLPAGTGVSLGTADENVPKLDSGGDCTILNILKIGEWYS